MGHGMSHFLPAVSETLEKQGFTQSPSGQEMGHWPGELSDLEMGQKWDMESRELTPRSCLGAIPQKPESGPKSARNTEILV